MNINSAIKNIFDQLVFVLEHLSTQEYNQPSISLKGFTIGQHMRHTLEFFKCLHDGIASQQVNYDERARDYSIESDAHSAIMLIGDLTLALDGLGKNEPLTLELSYANTESEKITVASNVDRELVYNIEHAIHHMALIAIGLREVKPTMQLPEGFGIASSTMRHIKSKKETI